MLPIQISGHFNLLYNFLSILLFSHLSFPNHHYSIKKQHWTTFLLSSAHNLKKRFYAGCQPRHPSECLKCRRYHWVPGADSPYLPGVGVIPFRVSNSPSNYPARAQYSFYVPLHETFWFNYIICDTLRNINSFHKFVSCFITLISVLINSFYNLYPILFYGNPTLRALASVSHQVSQEDCFPILNQFLFDKNISLARRKFDWLWKL